MGLFNCTICLPQIVASLVGGVLFMTFGGKDVYLEVPVAEEAKVEVVAEAEAPAAEAVEEVAVVEEVAEVAEAAEVAEVAEAAEVAEVAEAVEPIEEVVAEVVENTEEVVAEPEVKTELKKFQSGQIVMLVIAGISLLLGAIAVFGINTRREE
jgi:hypothetical protein